MDSRPLKLKCCPKAPSRRIPRDIDEDARDIARSLAGTPEFEQSPHDRKKVDMVFAHLRRIFGLGRLRLLTLIDEFSQECFAIRVARRIAGIEIIESLSDAMVMYGVQSTDTLSHELEQKFGCVTMIDENYTIEDHDCLGYRTHGWFMGLLFWTVVGVVLSVLTWLQFQDWR